MLRLLALCKQERRPNVKQDVSNGWAVSKFWRGIRFAKAQSLVATGAVWLALALVALFGPLESIDRWGLWVTLALNAVSPLAGGAVWAVVSIRRRSRKSNRSPAIDEEIPDDDDHLRVQASLPLPKAVDARGTHGEAIATRCRNVLLGRQDRAKLLEFARVYASHTGRVVPLTRLCDDSGVARATGREYVALLERTFLAHECPAFLPGGVGRVQRSPKRLLVDAGLAAAVWDSDAWTIRRSSDLRGRLMETFVAAQLRAEHDPRVTGYRLRHFRRDGGQEVDFVLDGGPQGVVGVEVEAGDRAGLHEARHLLWLRDQLGGRFTAGVVLHTGPRPPTVLSQASGGGGSIWSAPVATLWR